MVMYVMYAMYVVYRLSNSWLYFEEGVIMSRNQKKMRTYTPRRAAEDAKEDIHGGPDIGPGSSGNPFAMPYIKMRSEEAKLIQCPECGFSQGRHSKLCSKAK
jgi:hypothetical protein